MNSAKVVRPEPDQPDQWLRPCYKTIFTCVLFQSNPDEAIIFTRQRLLVHVATLTGSASPPVAT